MLVALIDRATSLLNKHLRGTYYGAGILLSQSFLLCFLSQPYEVRTTVHFTDVLSKLSYMRELVGGRARSLKQGSLHPEYSLKTTTHRF